LADWLGTVRAFYSYTGGNLAGTPPAHAPFGESYLSSGNPSDFTGQQSDKVTTNTTYYFLERQYRSSQGRWLSPDPAGLGAVDFSNPQSLNRYAYVLNNPLSSVDPTGEFVLGIEWAWYQCGFCSFGSTWDEFDLFNFFSPYEDSNEQIHWFPALGLVDFFAATANSTTPTKGPCSNIPSSGKTIPVQTPSGQINLQFNGDGALIGLAIQLTGQDPVQAGSLTVPPNTFIGITSNSGGVQFGFNNPVDFNGGLGGLKQAYFQTATFSNGQYSTVVGAWAPIGVPLGSSTGSSWLLRKALNGDQKALDVGNSLTRVAGALKSVTCTALFGGGSQK
jgi:RHS repeat-associated protein